MRGRFSAPDVRREGVLLIVLTLVVSALCGCGRSAAPPVALVDGVPAPTEEELGLPFLPQAETKSFSRGSGTDVAITLETDRVANDVADFYRKELGEGNYTEHVFEEDNSKVIGLWSESGLVRREVAIHEDFQTGNTTINLFKGAPTPDVSANAEPTP